MSRKKKAGTEPVNAKTIEADLVYRVKFRKPHTRGRDRFSPVHRYRMKGSILAEIPADKIASAEAIE